MNKKLKSLVAVAVLTTVAVTSLIGCSKKESGTTTTKVDETKPLELSIMLPNIKTDIIKDDSPVKKKLEEMTNTKLTFTWVPTTSYEDKFNITLASGDLPNILYAGGKTSSVISGAQVGAFWEIGPYLKDYANLSQVNKDIMWTTAIDGKYYGLYRSRDYGRNGIVYRKDWAQNLGIAEPKTIDDYYNMLKAFTNNDPDKNGKNDTYGVIAGKGNYTFYNSAVWFGAPNGWGTGSDGKLEPAFMTTGFKDALKFWKKLYSEKLLNQDFAVFEPAKMVDQFNAGKVGSMIDVIDSAQRSYDAMIKTDPSLTDKNFVDVIGSLTGPKGATALPTAGYAGMFIFPKSSNKTEGDLKRVLKFMDQTNNKDEAILINNGIENVTFKLDNGYTVPLDPAADPTILGEINQLGLGIPDSKAYKVKQNPIRIKVAETILANNKVAVANPAAPYVSQTYTTNGAQLDNIIEDARVKYIVGQIDDAGFDAAIENWKKQGGTAVIKEMNDEHAKYKNATK
jgi:putative aldouronate transport system substrate-binding protein